jgi:cysteine synthase B
MSTRPALEPAMPDPSPASLSFDQPADSILGLIGGTPMVRIRRMCPNPKVDIYAKLEGFNPTGSIKDRIALKMIEQAEQEGSLTKDKTILEPTSGNTGIALAMCAAMMGYRMILVMPEHLSVERRQTMAAFGAEIVLTPKEGGMEMARDIAEKMRDEGRGVILDQFANPDNPLSHYEGTAPEIWRDTQGRVTHFVSSMGTTGTIMGCSRYFKEMNPKIQVIGCQPTDGSQIPGIRKWPQQYLPKICDWTRIDRVIEVAQADAEEMTRRLAREEGVFAGISSGGALWAALQVLHEVEDAVIVSIICDRGDRYLSTGVFPG